MHYPSLAFAPIFRHILAAGRIDPVTFRDIIVLTKTFHSSGDAIADRRAGYARLLAEGGDFVAAADLISQALDLTPEWVAGWDLLGGYHDKAGNLSGAISAWRHLEALDDDGTFGAKLKLAVHGAGAADAGTAISYVEALFDQYAPKFESALVDKLGYRVPALLNDLLVQVMAETCVLHFTRALDLGCGTGLMGERLRNKVTVLEGIDLSAAMIAETGRKGLYDRLEKAELVQFLQRQPGEVDLVTAADVFIYCGALPPVLAAVVPVIRPGGFLTFSLEAHDGEEAVFLRPSLRYAHGMEAARQAVAKAGLEILRFETAVLRQDRGAPIEGLLIVARKPEQAEGRDEHYPL